jgi:glucose/arabinose dehydrogenase
VLIGVVTAVPSGTVSAGITEGITLQLVASGLATPVDLAAPAGDDRLFVVEKAGRIRIIDDGVVQSTPFLDITGPVDASAGERGLLGLAFDPNYAKNGRFYVNYTADAGGGDSRIARYRVSGNPDVADPDSGSVLLTIDQPYTNHNGGQVAIGPDGYLYASFGDGGSGGDPQGNGQNINSLLGSIVRINRFTGEAAPDNPFVGRSGADEIWAYGLRNPWRFDLDERTGDMFIADVGQGAWEEIDRIPAGVGGLNFGWNEREGAHCYLSNCETAGLIDPIVEYPHQADPCSGSITGGKVYRGNDLPQLRGHYFYTDYCKGGLHSFAFEDGQVVEETNWSFLNPPSRVLSFGTDGFGEMYLLAGSSVYKFVSTANPECDFDGDGDADLAAGAPGENHSGVADPGMLFVYEGNAAGFDPADDTRFWQGDKGVRNLAEKNDAFGSALVCGDFDGDGYSDLAIGAPGESLGGPKSMGLVNVLYGGPGGLSGDGDQVWHQDSPGIGGKAEKLDNFGAALASGDFNGDGYQDLAVGAPGETIRGVVEAGAVTVVLGSSSGLRSAGSQYLHQDANAVNDEAETSDQFGYALATGDFDGDGNDDLAVGVPYEEISGFAEAGMVQVFPGSGGGLTRSDRLWHRGWSAVEGTPASGEWFGFDLAAGNLTADGFDDLAVGVPGDASGSGSVAVLTGSGGGLTGNDLLLRQGADGIPGAAEQGDLFGWALAIGDFDESGIEDLAVGAPLESRPGGQGAGDVTVVVAGPGGLDPGLATVWYRGVDSLEGSLATSSGFGLSLAIVDVDADDADDLIVYAQASNATGELHLLPGSPSGISGNGDVLWDQDTPGVLGVAQPGDLFGSGLP